MYRVSSRGDNQRYRLLGFSPDRAQRRGTGIACGRRKRSRLENMPTFLRCTRIIGLLVAVVAPSAACGGSPTSSSSTNNPPVATNTITITSAGVSPNSIRITVGTRVTMVNNDSRVHDMDSDPHPEHTQCPQINWGTLQPGQSRDS